MISFDNAQGSVKIRLAFSAVLLLITLIADSERYIEWQRVTKSGTMSDNK